MLEKPAWGVRLIYGQRNFEEVRRNQPFWAPPLIALGLLLFFDAQESSLDLEQWRDD